MLPRGQGGNPEGPQTAVVFETSADETLWSPFGFPDAALRRSAQNRDFFKSGKLKQTNLSLSPTPSGRRRRASFLFSLPLSRRFPSAARSLDATDRFQVAVSDEIKLIETKRRPALPGSGDGGSRDQASRLG